MTDDTVLRLGEELIADILAVWRPFWRFSPKLDRVWPEMEPAAPEDARCFVCNADLSGKAAIWGDPCKVYACPDMGECLHRRDEAARANRLKRYRSLVDSVRAPSRERVEEMRRLESPGTAYPVATSPIHPLGGG